MANTSNIFLSVTSTGYNKYKDRMTGFSLLDRDQLETFSDPDEVLCLQKLYAGLEGKRVITFDGGERLLPFLSWRSRHHQLDLDWSPIVFADQKSRLKALRPLHPGIQMRSKAFAKALEEGLLSLPSSDPIPLKSKDLEASLAQALIIQTYLDSLREQLTLNLDQPRAITGQVYHTERLTDGVFLRLKTDSPGQALFLQTDTYRVEGDLADMEVTLFARPVQTETGQGLAYVVRPETRDYVLIADGERVLLENLMTSVKKTLVHMMGQIGL